MMTISSEGAAKMPDRVTVYFDGFNFYHAIHDTGRNHLKWVNLWGLSELFLREGEELSAVKYFSAFVTWNEAGYRRHQRYVAALKAVNVNFFEGKFQKNKTVKCNHCGKRFKKPEEKETDVNIAIQLVSDALQDKYEKAILVSADTDFIPAVRMVRNQSRKRVEIWAPPGRSQPGRGLAREITEVMIEQSLLPDKVILSKGKAVFRPQAYNPPV